MNMDNRITGYREVIPEQLQQDKWKELTLNTGENIYITLKFVSYTKIVLDSKSCKLYTVNIFVSSSCVFNLYFGSSTGVTN